MFKKKDYTHLSLAAILLLTGYTLMLVDPEDNGFGLNTLWIAPPLLLAGFLIPALVLSPPVIFGGGGSKQWVLSSLPEFFVFATAFAVYIVTLEPTASLWDCSEFIASSYKLQVPHTPGTPLALLIGRVFSLLSFGDVFKVAWTLNAMSALFSAMTVAVVYRIIVFLGKRVVKGQGRMRHVILIVSASSASLCLAFSDTFWFSAVEAETYGPASFFMSLIVWLIVTISALEPEIKAKRLVLIFYLAGLAYCVHPMCLLALSLLPFSWSNPAKKLNMRRAILLLLAGLGLVFVVNRVVIVGVFEMAFALDLFAVNHLHLPFYSGAVVLLILVCYFSRWLPRRFPTSALYVQAGVFLLIGLTPYLVLFIRSNHNPPIDETNPENLALIKAYMNREGYPSSPLLYGPYFDAQITGISAKRNAWYRSNDTYKIAGTIPEYEYDERQTLLPRIYSNEAAHVETYRTWTGLREHERPKFSDNIQFMFRYQLGHMYLRYLMWNFAGRESDVQNSRWLWPWERLSDGNFETARNQYWMVPLLIGVFGAVFQCRKDRKGFISTLVFFLVTGIVLVLYLNSPPNEPRERDYIYVGSYIAFCIWIGVGFASACSLLRGRRNTILVAMVLCISVPAWMVFQNFDDHDRSGRTLQIDNARNMLRSCLPDAILFTGGDNDTFPLWYLQEVEGFRTDVRVMVLSYMNTDWYISQLRRRYYKSEAFALTLDEKDYLQYGPNDVLYVQEMINGPADVEQYLSLLKEGHPSLIRMGSTGKPYHILPSKRLKLDVTGRDTTSVVLNVEGNYLSKNALAILDLIVTNKWKRPVHFNFTSLNTLGLNLTENVVQEGLLYRLVAHSGARSEIAVDTRRAYENLIEKADYACLTNPHVYLTYEDHYARILVPLRQAFNTLAAALYERGEHEAAENVLLFAVEKLYHEHLRPAYTNLQAASLLLELSNTDAAKALTRQAMDYYGQVFHDSQRRGSVPDPIAEYLFNQAMALFQACSASEVKKENADQ